MIEGRQAVTEDYTVVDLEMTGLTPKQDKIIEIGAVKVQIGRASCRERV